MSDINEQSLYKEARIFVIETCENCKEHQWNTRHDQAKYEDFFNRVSSAIVERVPGALAMRNQIPKTYVNFDLYCNLIPNEDQSLPYFQQVPRTGAFEVSYKGLLIFSKLGGCYWPNVELVANKCMKVVQEEEQGHDVTAFLAGMSPQKDGTSSPSRVKGRKARKLQDSAVRSQPINLKEEVIPQQIIQNVPQQVIPEPVYHQEEEVVLRQEVHQEEQLYAESPHQSVEIVEDRAPSHNSRPETASSKFIGEDQPHASVIDEPKGDFDEKAEPTVQEPVAEQIAAVELDVECGPHLKSGDDLSGFPCFPEGTASTLAKCLTREMWAQFKDQKDAMGFSFKDCILSGCANIDSEIGVYAGSANSYHAFAPLFNQIVSKSAPSNMDDSQLNAAEDLSEFVKDTQISVGRNIAAFPLCPGLSRSQRQEVETSVSGVLKQLTDELAGTYETMGDMPTDQWFAKGDRFKESAGLNREWPEGRGVFKNSENTFNVLVNQTEHIDISSRSNGGDISKVFTRLSHAHKQIQNVYEFAHDSTLGYLTACPSTIGSASLTACCYVRLPECTKIKEDLQKVAESNGLTCSALDSDCDTYFISTKKHPEKSEVDIINCFYSGVKQMCDREKTLKPAEIKEASVEDNVGEVIINEGSEAGKTHVQKADHGVDLDGPAEIVEQIASNDEGEIKEKEASIHEELPKDESVKEEPAKVVEEKAASRPASVKAESVKAASRPTSVKAESVKAASRPASVKAESVKAASRPASVKAESVKAASRPASVKPESVKAESVKHEEPAKAESVKAASRPASVKAESVKAEPTKAESVKAESVKAASRPASVKAESVKHEEPIKEEKVEEPVKEEPVKEEPAKVEPAKEEKVEEPVKAEPAKEEPVKAEPVKEEPAKEEAAKETKVEEPVKEEPVKVEAAKEEKVEETVKAEPAKEEPVKEEKVEEPAKAESVKQEEPAKAEIAESPAKKEASVHEAVPEVKHEEAKEEAATKEHKETQ